MNDRSNAVRHREPAPLTLIPRSRRSAQPPVAVLAPAAAAAVVKGLTGVTRRTGGAGPVTTGVCARARNQLTRSGTLCRMCGG